jgi:hypothetical protein
MGQAFLHKKSGGLIREDHWSMLVTHLFFVAFGNRL